MSNQYLSFDVTKQAVPQDLIIGRQGDSQLKFVSILFWDGEKNIPYDLTGKQVVFEALKPDGTHIVDTAGITILNATGGLVRYSFNEQVFAVAGTMQQAFFKITQTDSQNNVITDSTLEINIRVLENRVEFGINSTDYLSEYDKLIADVEKKFDDFSTTVNNDIQKAQQIHDEIVSYTNLINQNAVLLRSDAGYTNVKWFGATGDGMTDDTNAFNLAYQDALNKKTNKLYIPSGSYVVNFKNMLIKNFEVEGAGREQTFLLQQGVDPLFDVKSFSKIHNLAIYNLNSTTTTSIVVKNSDEVTSYYNIRLESLYFQGSEAVGYKSGQWVYTPILFDLNGKGLWDVRIDDIEALWVDKGVSVDTTNGGWFTGSLFNNIIVKAFSTFAVGLISSNNTLRQISQNVFSNLTAEILYKTALNAVGFVISGQGNDFNNLMLFNDGEYSGKAIQIKNYSPSSSYANPGWSSSTSENTINGGTLEGIIDDPDGLIDFQNFNGVRLITKNASGIPVMTTVSSNKHANLLSQGLISDSLKENSTLIQNHGTSVITGIDENGKFIQITNTAYDSYHYIPFPDTENTLSTLINKNFTVGIRYKKISGSGVKLGTIRFDESMNPDAPKYKFDNTALNKDVVDATWVFPANSSFLTPLIGKSRRFDGVYFQINANSTVRIYNAFLTVGMLSSFNKISADNLTNTLVNSGSRNFVKSPNNSISIGEVTNSKGINKSFDVDLSLLNWQKRRNIIISADINVNDLNTDNVTGRLPIAVELSVTYSDGTKQAYNTGVGLLNVDVIENRYSHFFTLPNKVITGATLNLMVSPGVSASYLFIGNPQVERGSIAHDYIPYVPLSPITQ